MKSSQNKVREVIRRTQEEVLALLQEREMSYEAIARRVRRSARTVYNIAQRNRLRRKEASAKTKGRN